MQGAKWVAAEAAAQGMRAANWGSASALDRQSRWIDACPIFTRARIAIGTFNLGGKNGKNTLYY